MTQPVIEQITALVSSIMKDQLDLTVEAANISADTVFDDLGVDSLVLVEVAVMVRQQFGVEVTDEELADAETIRGAAEIINQRRGKVA